MAIKRVVIHLGTAKAGSTSIQRALFTNSAILERNGFRYLTEWGENHFRYFRTFFSPDPVGSLDRVFGPFMTEEERQNCIKSMIDTMLQVINTTDCETLILSGEYWGDFYRDSAIVNIKEFLENYFIRKGIESTIMYIVRNPLTWMTSLLHQALLNGFYDRDSDYYEDRMNCYYKVICNLQKHFGNSLVLLKFEDAINDADGFVGCFLKIIGFPQEEIHNINILISKLNESSCMEVMEFFNYIEDIEPFLPFGIGNKELNNPNRYQYDLHILRDIKGVKFDLPYRSKVELWERFEEIIHLIKVNTGIDYTDYKISLPVEQETYSEKTICDFIEVFPKLSPILQRYFLKFFEKKYAETAQVKFKRLYFRDSIPRLLYKKVKKESSSLLDEAIAERDALLNSRSWRITKPLREAMAVLKRIAGKTPCN